MKGGPEGDSESPSSWWDTRTCVELAIFGSKSSQNTSERVDIEVGKCGGEAQHEVELGTHEDVSTCVAIDAGGIWEHKDIALRCVGVFSLVVSFVPVVIWGRCGHIQPFQESPWLCEGPSWTKGGQVVVVTTRQCVLHCFQHV